MTGEGHGLRMFYPLGGQVRFGDVAVDVFAPDYAHLQLRKVGVPFAHAALFPPQRDGETSWFTFSGRME